jgi:hypothetical protein
VGVGGLSLLYSGLHYDDAFQEPAPDESRVCRELGIDDEKPSLAVGQGNAEYQRPPGASPEEEDAPEEDMSPLPSLEATSIAPTASEIRWDLEPAPDDPYTSDKARAYRELLQVALEELADLQKRLENSQSAIKEYRARERARNDRVPSESGVSR